MFEKKDYLEFFKQLYGLEVVMEKEAAELLGLIKRPEAQAILKAVIRDERKHKKIVKGMIKLVKENLK